MPYVNIKITREGATAEQKEQLIAVAIFFAFLYFTSQITEVTKKKKRRKERNRISC